MTMRRKTYLAAAVVAAVVWTLAFSLSCPAATFNLDTDFETMEAVHFGTVRVTDTGDDLVFEVALNTAALGPNADIRDFWFNVSPDIVSITVSDKDPNLGSAVVYDPNSVGPTGNNRFDVEVNFGNGTPFYSIVRFTLSANRSLDIADLFFRSEGNQGGFFFGFHAQSTDYEGRTSVKGGTGEVPLPPAVWLLGSGLLGLLGFRRKGNAS